MVHSLSAQYVSDKISGNTTNITAMQYYFASGATQSYPFRLSQLKKLRTAIQANEQTIMQALYNDLHKSPEEAYTTEIGFIYTELTHAIKNLKKWMRPQRVSSPLLLFPSSSKIIRQPYGVSFIIAPWNYPFQLLMAPLIGAIAGGNCALLKPSEISGNTSLVIEKLIQENFDPAFISVVTGDGAVVVPQLMNEYKFDHVFFTGSIAVGKQIATLATPSLIPVVLELGGKSPCIVDEDVDIKVAAQRITWGKFTNAGQTCVAPDYLLVHESRKTALLTLMQQSIRTFYGNDPIKSPDYGRIINQKRFDKLEGFLHEGNIVSGGNTSREQLYISPTIIDGLTEKAAIMQEEIFGPILPVFTYKTHSEAMEMIQRHADPLALYIFTNNKKTAKLYTESIAFGGGCVNNTILHLANANLPFGGVRNSGLGAYHGKYSFEAFTHAKAIISTATWFDPAVKYPPYGGKLNMIKKIQR